MRTVVSLGLALTLSIAGAVGIPSAADATADPPHNTIVDRLIQSPVAGTNSTSCEVDYQHGNVYAVGYAKLRRSSGAFPKKGFLTGGYANPGQVYGWDELYGLVPDGQPNRCHSVRVTVGVVFAGSIYEYANSGSGTGWVQANGPVYSNIVASRGYVKGQPVVPLAGPAADRYAPGI